MHKLKFFKTKKKNIKIYAYINYVINLNHKIVFINKVKNEISFGKCT